MITHDVQFYVYGHDHLFCHSVVDDRHYISCSKLTSVNEWVTNSGFVSSYGDVMTQGVNHPWIEQTLNVVGGMVFSVSHDEVTFKWIRTGYSYPNSTTPIKLTARDWNECYVGETYTVTNPYYVDVAIPFRRVSSVYTVSGAHLTAPFESPTGINYLANEPILRCILRGNARRIPLTVFPENLAVVECIPEIVYSHTVTDVDD
jgi:hypothetical protein